MLSSGIIFAVAFISYFTGSVSADPPNDIPQLKKIGEINETFPDTEDNYFWCICDLCCDKKGNLYVADSGWNKIFKFDSDYKFVISAGKGKIAELIGNALPPIFIQRHGCNIYQCLSLKRILE